MTEQFVPKYLALKLKELGFNEECLGRYIFKTPELKWSLQLTINKNNVLGSVSAPLWGQAFDWFREKHGLYIITQKHYNFWAYSIRKNNHLSTIESFGKNYKTYEEAREACLTKLIELCQ